MLNGHGGNAAACAIAVAEASRRHGLLVAAAMPSDLVEARRDRGPLHGRRGSFETSLLRMLDPSGSGSTWRGRLGGAHVEAARLVVGDSRWQELDAGFTDRPDEALRERGEQALTACVAAVAALEQLAGAGARDPRADDRAVETATVSAAKPALRVRGQRAVVTTRSTFTLVRVVTDDGIDGFGEVSATAASGEDAVTATHFVRDVLGPGPIGRPLAPIESHATEFDRAAGQLVHQGRRQHGALGRPRARRGVTVAELLGGPYRREVL